jgi:hypothetical protein
MNATQPMVRVGFNVSSPSFPPRNPTPRRVTHADRGRASVIALPVLLRQVFQPLFYCHAVLVRVSDHVFLAMLLSTIRRIASDLLGLSGSSRLHLSSASRKSGDSLIEVTASCPVAGRPRLFFVVRFIFFVLRLFCLKGNRAV